MKNATKIVIRQSTPGVIHATRLTKGYSYNEAHSNEQCNKTTDSSMLPYLSPEIFPLRDKVTEIN